MSQTTEFLLERLRKGDAFPLFVTGAGISLASGIPTFRGTDPDAVWANDVLEKGTFRFFESNPVESWKWYLARFDKCRSAKPNPGHQAIAAIEQKLLASGRRCLTVTQNIDGLHLDAGTKNLIEVHGSARKMRCARRGCINGEPEGTMPWLDALWTAFRQNPSLETVPRCPACNKLMRAHVLWFDEGYGAHMDYGIDRLFEVSGPDDVNLVVFVGTSFAVNITAIVIQQAYSLGVPMFTIDPTGETPDQDILPIKARAEVFLPALAEAL